MNRLEEVYNIFKKHTQRLSSQDMKNPAFWIEEWSPTAHFRDLKTLLDEKEEEPTTTKRKRTESSNHHTDHIVSGNEKKIKKEPSYSSRDAAKSSDNSRKTDHSDFFQALFDCN